MDNQKQSRIVADQHIVPTATMLRMFLPLAAFVGGCAVQLQQRALLETWIYVCFCLPALIYAAHCAIKEIATRERQSRAISANDRIAGLLMLTVSAACLGFGQAGWRASVYQSQALASELEGQDIRITGVIAAMPQRDESGIRFRLDVESAQRLQDGKALTVQLPPRVQVAWYHSLPRLSEDAANVAFAELHAGAGDIKAGERWQMMVRLKAPHGNLNPHGFDYELWLWEQGVQATGYVRATPKELARGDGPVKLGDARAHPFEALRQRMRDAIFERIEQPQWAGVIAALAVGDQAAIDRADWDVYRATGVAHLMSISGLHITMFAWGAALVLGSLWRRQVRWSSRVPTQHVALVGGVLMATAYALFSGWNLPAQRTVLMLCAVALLRLSGRHWPWPLVWLASLAMIVASDPWALLSAGFWLSFFAVGILFASSGGQPVSQADFGRGRRAWALLREQWVISIALAPLSLLLFNQVSVVGLVANVLAIPWVTLVITPLALLGALFSPLWSLAAWAVQGLGAVLGWLASLPLATISIAASADWMSAFAIFGGILMVMQLPWAARISGLALVLPVLWVQPERPAPSEFRLLGADVGQGNAVLVQTARHSLLYDAGPRFSRESDAGQRTLVPLLRALGERLDVLVISHRDADHIGGAAAVLQMQRQARLLSSIEAEHELQQLRPAERCVKGQRWQWDGVDFEILHPAESDYARASKPNALSCVLRISNGHQAALLTGDLEAAQELRLVIDGSALRADLLLVPHHGSKTSSTEEFLDAVKPSLAWVQAGYRNRFQHPTSVILERYAERGIAVSQSARCGAAHWRSSHPHEVACQRNIQQRYWHHRVP